MVEEYTMDVVDRGKFSRVVNPYTSMGYGRKLRSEDFKTLTMEAHCVKFDQL